MLLSRRKVLFGGLAGIAALAAAPLLTRRIDDEIRRILRRNFGEEIALAPDAELFVSDVAGLWDSLNSEKNQIIKPTLWKLDFVLPFAQSERISLEQSVVELFLRSSNVVRVHETGEGILEYLGIPNPYEAPCTNPLSFAWL